ncbi:MAG: PPOX class F420-dependent oxidoreductase [Dehalococcoidia bacterium]
MTFDQALPFLRRRHASVVTTFRRDGAAQMSILVSGVRDGRVVFVVRGNTAKLANLRRDPRCTVLTLSPDWSAYVTVEGTASIKGWDNTDAEELRLLLREAFRACGDKDHPEWEEYDRVMREERRAVVSVQPQRVYGFFGPG